MLFLTFFSSLLILKSARGGLVSPKQTNIAFFKRIKERFSMERTPMNVKQAIIQDVPQWAILRPSNSKENMGLSIWETAPS